jgi:hypothetical protein
VFNCQDVCFRRLTFVHWSHVLCLSHIFLTFLFALFFITSPLVQILIAHPPPSQPDGSFAGDRWGEIDTRFSYCVLNCLALLKRSHLVDAPKAVDFIVRCQVCVCAIVDDLSVFCFCSHRTLVRVRIGMFHAPNFPAHDSSLRNISFNPRSLQNFDGGFGSTLHAESHAGQIFCCLGALAIAGALVCVISVALRHVIFSCFAVVLSEYVALASRVSLHMCTF